MARLCGHPAQKAKARPYQPSESDRFVWHLVPDRPDIWVVRLWLLRNGETKLMATIQDVAKHAHVGVGTVSRVLSGKGYVKETTRQKVLDSIQVLDYTPNEMARNLFFRKTGIVAVIVPELSHPFFAEFVNAVEVALCENDYQTMICNTYYEQNYELRYLDMLKRQKVDGIIFCAHTLDVEQYQNVDRPIVALDRDLGGGIPCVAVDHQEGGRLAAEELIRAGCRNVMQFGGSTGEYRVSTPSNQRYEVFAQVMREHGIPCYCHPMKWNSFDYQYYMDITKQMLDDRPDVDGIFATDLIVMAALRAALSKGKRVPEELKLVAYDGTKGIDLMSPSITTIVQPITELASESVRLMMDLIQGRESEKRNIKLRVSLRRGASTGWT